MESPTLFILLFPSVIVLFKVSPKSDTFDLRDEGTIFFRPSATISQSITFFVPVQFLHIVLHIPLFFLTQDIQFPLK